MIDAIPSPAVNPLDPEFARDPYPTFEYLRRHDPIQRDEVMNAWIVTSFDACIAVMHDPRFVLDIREGYGDKVDALLVEYSVCNPGATWLLN